MKASVSKMTLFSPEIVFFLEKIRLEKKVRIKFVGDIFFEQSLNVDVSSYEMQ